MDKLSLRFDRANDMIVFNRFDLDQNDFDFLDFDKVPRVMFYPKAVHAKGVEIKVFDDQMGTLPQEVIYNQIRHLMDEYQRAFDKVEVEESTSGIKVDLWFVYDRNQQFQIKGKSLFLITIYG